MTTATVAGSQPWYRSLNANQWKTMIASNLGWMFDGYETFALILVVGVALRDLLDPSQFAQIPAFAGTVIGITLLGWGIGGVIGGVLADYIGRRRTMILAILAYSLTTGLSAFAWDWVSFALLRFLVGIAIGSEWSTGASMTAEVWPDNARGRGAGLMQCGLGIGFFLASFIWLFVSGYGPGAWRIMFLIGVIPALFALWLRTGVQESGRWEQSNEKRKSAHAKKKSGATLSAEDHALTRFTFADLFADPEIRKRTIIVFLMSLTTTVAWWGISTWVPPFIAAAAGKAGLPPQTWASYAGMSYNLGAIIGYIGLGFLADHFGRKPIVMIFFAGSLVLTLRALPVDDRPASLAAGRGAQWLLHARPIFVDVGLAAGAVPDPHASHRNGLRFQRSALHRVYGAAVRRHADRPVRRLQQDGGGVLVHLHSGLCRGAVLAGDQRQAVAGLRSV